MYRQLYRTFPIVHALRAQLSWIQCKLLLGVYREKKRELNSIKIGKANKAVNTYYSPFCLP
ncbi:hypothetical protein [Sphingobacterium kitahiroshimense]|uniref:hypothetical protein n=1 Tax=Sphingobacterium kitahiroshimense TaxID=470446 RepID=UPI003D3695A2